MDKEILKDWSCSILYPAVEHRMNVSVPLISHFKSPTLIIYTWKLALVPSQKTPLTAFDSASIYRILNKIHRLHIATITSKHRDHGHILGIANQARDSIAIKNVLTPEMAYRGRDYTRERSHKRLSRLIVWADSTDVLKFQPLDKTHKSRNGQPFPWIFLRIARALKGVRRPQNRLYRIMYAKNSVSNCDLLGLPVINILSPRALKFPWAIEQ